MNKDMEDFDINLSFDEIKCMSEEGFISPDEGKNPQHNSSEWGKGKTQQS